MSEAEKPAASAPVADPKPAPAAEPEAFAVLLQQHGEIRAGRIVRGPQSEIRALKPAVARPATPEDLSIAGGRSVPLPKAR